MGELTMGEIKSTLDLVLEKTRHLSQTSEEKQAQTLKNSENRINGLLQKYVDGLFSLEQLQRDYEKIIAEFKLPNHAALAGQVIRRLDPGQDNRVLFDLLDLCCHLDSSGLADVINQYQARYQKAAQVRMEALKENLAQKYNISGSAVIPDLDTDDNWRREAQAMTAAVEEKLKQEKERLIGIIDE
jgi:hypothetical protein